MRILSAVLFAMLALLTSSALACDDHDHGGRKKKGVTGRESAWIPGEVREVDPEDGTITLGHAKIPALGMGAMESMMFKAANSKVIANAKPGEKVRFRVRVVNDHPTVTRIEVARP